MTSSNIGTIKIAQQLGAEPMDSYLGSLRVRPEDRPRLPRARPAASSVRSPPGRARDIGAIPIGQGIAVTAIQMLTAYNVIANDGVYVAPKLVAATDDGSGQDRAPSRTATGSCRRHRPAMQSMLAKVVSDGTGKKAAVPGYQAAGKTGTARIPQQRPRRRRGYLDAHGRYHYPSSFVGFVVGADLSIMVVTEEAQTSIYASDTAAPVFAQLA